MPPTNAKFHTFPDEKVCRIALFESATIGFCPEYIFSSKTVCLFALSGGAAGYANRKWCYYLQSRLHIRVFARTRFSFHASARIRHPDKLRKRVRAYQLSEISGFGKSHEPLLKHSRDCVSEVPPGSQKCKKTHFREPKSVGFYRHFVVW